MPLRDAYEAARAEAQAKANATGFDYGLECNPIFKTWTHYMLPRWENRTGHELRCEVVSCENIANTKPGHGHAARVSCAKRGIPC